MAKRPKTLPFKNETHRYLAERARILRNRRSALQTDLNRVQVELMLVLRAKKMLGVR